jgi:hypothetical protein
MRAAWAMPAFCVPRTLSGSFRAKSCSSVSVAKFNYLCSQYERCQHPTKPALTARAKGARPIADCPSAELPVVKPFEPHGHHGLPRPFRPDRQPTQARQPPLPGEVALPGAVARGTVPGGPTPQTPRGVSSVSFGADVGAAIGGAIGGGAAGLTAAPNLRYRAQGYRRVPTSAREMAERGRPLRTVRFESSENRPQFGLRRRLPSARFRPGGDEFDDRCECTGGE